MHSKIAKEWQRAIDVCFALCGGAIGISFGRLFMTKLQQESAIAIVIICFLVFSLLYCFGTINLLKVYYINKYNLEKYKHIEEADK